MDTAFELLRLAAVASPIVARFLRNAVDAMRGDPDARRVEAVLPPVSQSREAEEEIRRQKAHAAFQAALEQTGSAHTALEAYEAERA